jgi:hypothetical protein
MQFLTVRQPRRGSDQIAYQVGPRGEFFAFDYEVTHDPTNERVGVQVDPDVEKHASWDYRPDIHIGTRIGWEDSMYDDAARLCCVKLNILATRDNPVDTSPRVIRSLLIEFVRKRITEWAEPITFRPEWLTSDVVALAQGIRADAVFERLPILCDALQDAGCADPLVIEHLRTCPDHSPSCWVVEMILDQLG